MKASSRLRSYRPCGATTWHRAWSTLVTLVACLSLCNGLNDITANKSVCEALEAEIQVLRQQIAQLHGAAAVGSDPVGRSAPGLKPFVPRTANLRRVLGTRTVLWPHYWSFLSAVSTDSKVTASHIMTDRQGGAGSSVFVVLGDATGRLYFFAPAGELLYEHNTGVAAAITALSSQLLHSNTSQLAVGFDQGTMQLLEIGHDSIRSSEGSGIHLVTPMMTSTPEEQSQQQLNETVDMKGRGPAIRHISFTKSNKQRRMLLVVDESGQVLLLLPPTGRIMLARYLDAPPLAVNTNTDYQVVIQTPTAAVVVLLHRGRSTVVRSCTGLAAAPDTTSSSSSSSGHPAAAPQPDGDALVAAAFDPGRSFRVFGVTAAGELLALVVPSAQRTMNCRVVQRLPLGLPPGPVQLVASKGRLVLLHVDGVAVFNTTQPLKLAGSHMVSHTWKDVWQMYGLAQHYDQEEILQSQLQTQQQAQQEEDGTELLNAALPGPEQNSGACSGRLLHTAAWQTNALTAAMSGNLLLLPLGTKAVAAFAAAEGIGQGLAGRTGASKGDASVSMDWLKMLQPFVIIMMVVVGVWQFIRASNRNQVGQRGMRGLGTGYGSGLEGLGPEDLGQLGLGMAGGLFGGGGGGFSGGLDRDFGPYTGRRSNIRRGMTERESGTDPYGGLGALGARRRAHQLMHGRPERGAGGRGRGLQQAGGTVFSMRGNANTAAAARAGLGGSSRGADGPRGGLRRSDPGAAGSSSGGRRVTFEDLADDLGGDDVGHLPVDPMQLDHAEAVASGDVVPAQQHDALGAFDGDAVEGAEQEGVGLGQLSSAWEGDAATELLMQQMAAVGLDEGDKGGEAEAVE